MKKPTFAPIYLTLFPNLAMIAYEHGYALAAHGSLQKDMDLVAVPWTDNADTADALMSAIGKYLKLFEDIWGTEIHGPTDKPHGRKSWLLAVGFGSGIDLSVMPRHHKMLYEPEVPDTWIKPVMQGYKMQCCDCGLIHEMDFQVVKVLERRKDGELELTHAGPDYEVEFMARRVDDNL